MEYWRTTTCRQAKVLPIYIPADTNSYHFQYPSQAHLADEQKFGAKYVNKLYKWIEERIFGSFWEGLERVIETERRQNASLTLSGLLAIFVFVGPALLYSQSRTELPDAPLPAMKASLSDMFFTSVVATSQTDHKLAPTKKHRWLNVYNLSLATLAVGEVVDTWGTHENMTHPIWLCGFDSSWPAGETAITASGYSNYKSSNMKSTCGVSPTGVQANYMFDVTLTNSFMEGGWAAKWKLTGDRNYAGVEAWNVGLDVVQAIGAHYLHKRGPWEGRVGSAANYSHALAHLYGGICNFRFVSQNRTPAEWANNNASAFDWPAPYWWGKK
jgi:hypothetical protein